MSERHQPTSPRPNLVPRFYYGEQPDAVVVSEEPRVVESVGDIIKIGKTGNTFHRPDGKFLSDNEHSLIKAHAGMIREGEQAYRDEMNVATLDVGNEISQVDEQSAVFGDELRAQAALDPEEKIEGDAEKLEKQASLEVFTPPLNEEHRDQLAVLPESEPHVDSGDTIVTTPSELPADTGVVDAEIEDDGGEDEPTVRRTLRKRLRDAITPTGLAAELDRLKAVTVEKLGTHKKTTIALGAVALGAGIATYFLLRHSGTDTGLGAPKGTGGGATNPQLDLWPVTPDASGSWPADTSFPAKAFNVRGGEGWYQTFSDMNIPTGERAQLLQKVGPQLVDQGYAYFDNVSREYRMNAPGTLPESVLKLIQTNR